MDTELLGLYAILLALLAAAGTCSAAPPAVPPPAMLTCRMPHLLPLHIIAAYGVLNLAQSKGWVKKPRKSKPAVGECLEPPFRVASAASDGHFANPSLCLCSGRLWRQVRVAEGHRGRQVPQEGVTAAARDLAGQISVETGSAWAAIAA